MKLEIAQEAAEALQKIVEQANKVVCIMHKNPDGDAVGSSLAMCNLLQKVGKDCCVVSPNQYPAFLHWLPGNEQVLVYERKAKESRKHLREADLVLCLDFNMPNRIGDLEKEMPEIKGKTVLIDHHPNPSDFADVVISDTHVSSTCELVFGVIDNLGLAEHLSKEAATCLYTGLMTDTGSFSYNSSRPYTYHVVAELLKRGIDKDLIHDKVYDNYSEGRMRLLGYMLLERMEVLPEYCTAYIKLTSDDLKRFDFQPGDTEGFVNYPLSIKGVRFTAIFIEKDDQVKISFRSKGLFPTNEFSAANFNGGGHRNASGGHFQGALEDAIILFHKVLPEYKEQLINPE